MRDVPEDIEGIQIINDIKYLGIIIENKRNYLKTHKENMIKRAIKLANITYSVIEKKLQQAINR